MAFPQRPQDGTGALVALDRADPGGGAKLDEEVVHPRVPEPRGHHLDRHAAAGADGREEFPVAEVRGDGKAAGPLAREAVEHAVRVLDPDEVGERRVRQPREPHGLDEDLREVAEGGLGDGRPIGGRLLRKGEGEVLGHPLPLARQEPEREPGGQAGEPARRRRGQRRERRAAPCDERVEEGAAQPPGDGRDRDRHRAAVRVAFRARPADPPVGSAKAHATCDEGDRAREGARRRGGMLGGRRAAGRPGDAGRPHPGGDQR